MSRLKMLSGFVLAMLIIIGIAACEKETEQESYDSKQEKKDAVVEAIFDEVSEISDLAYQLGANGMKTSAEDNSRLNGCATITIDTTVMPHVMLIDFGEENCLGGDGKWRRGQIIVTFTGPYHQPGTVITLTFNNYYVNDNHVQGSKVMTNLGPNEDGHPEYSTVVDGSVTLNDGGGVISWQSERLRTWIEGYNTPMWYDNVFLITGSGTRSHSNGAGFTRTILEPLRKELTCHHFVSGVVQTVPVNRPTRTLDYGDGTCDNIATVTVGNRTFIIRLP